MKVVKQKTHLTLDNVEAQSFGLVFDEQMVDILSNQLYENSILAIVRELSTNAHDSQVEAGYTDPFNVHLPTWDEPTFWIRDYGTGMTPEKIDQVYRFYGSSDRRDSNSFTGCKGLGSKTPFCYHTKSCTIESYVNGTKWAYSCFLNEDGIPQIAMLSQNETDEHNGVKIIIPIRKEDRYEFEKCVKKVYRFFDTTPNIYGSKLEIEKPTYILEGDFWKCKDSRNGSMKIIMGNVAYNVDEYALGELTPAQRKVVNKPLHVYASLGDVAVSASREGLHYTNRTKTHVRGYINKIIGDFNNKIQEKVNKCKNLWEARLTLITFSSERNINLFDPSKITYNGEKLLDDTGRISLYDMIKDEKISIKHFVYSHYRKNNTENARDIKVSESPLFYINDLKTGAIVRSKEVANNEKRDVYLITFKKDCKQEFLDRIGFDETYLKNISTIPSPTKRCGTKRGNLTRVVKYREVNSSIKSRYWENEDIDFNNGGVYVEFNRYNVRLKGCLQHPVILYKILKYARFSGMDIPDIYGIKTADINMVKNSKWESIEDYILKEIKKINTNDMNSIIANYDMYNKVDTTWGNKLRLHTIHKLADLCPNTYIKTYSDSVKKVKKLSEEHLKAEKFRILCGLMNIDCGEKVVKPISLTSMESKLYKKYPLLLVLNSSFSVEDCKTLVPYINLMENENVV